MLATLNIQLPSMEATAELPASSVLAPKSGLTKGGGFADMLRFRVDAALLADPLGGELLPPGGSELPLIEVAGELVPDSPAAPESLVELPVDPEVPITDTPEIAFDVAIDYDPQLIEGTTPLEPAETDLPVMPTALLRQQGLQGSMLAAKDGEAFAPPVADSRPAATPRVSQANIAARAEELAVVVASASNVPPPAVVLTNRGLQGSAVAPTIPLPGELIESVPAAQLPRQPDVGGLQVSAPVVEEISETFTARQTVVQPVQVLHSQPNPQQAQVLLATTPAVTSAGETSYTAIAQQVTDLVQTPVRDSAWGEHIAERVLMMAGNPLKTAEIRLTPAELGPLRVQVSVEDGAANVSFQVQHAVTREALEQALPRLREMLAENGLSLGQASVGEQGVAERNRDERPDAGVAAPAGDEILDGGEETEQHTPPAALSSSGLVDTFA